jgi:drug/metabolite transporter (DMT)-like permease
MSKEENIIQEKTNDYSRSESTISVISDIYFNDINATTKSKSNKTINQKKLYLKSDLKDYLLSNENLNLNIERKANNLLGILYLFISVFLLSLAHLISKFLIVYFPQVENYANNFIRGIILLVLSQILLKRKNVSLIHQLKTNRNKTILLLFRCFFGAVCNITLFESFKYMRISSAFTIFCTYPIFVSIISILILKSEFSFFDILSYFSSIFSVILISKPAFIFTDNSANEPGSDTIYGIVLSVLSSILNAIGVYINKSIAYDFDNLVSPYFFGFWFIIITGILLPFSDNGFSTLNSASFALIVFSSLIFFFGIMLFVEALNVGEPIKVLPMFYFGVVFSLIYNTFIFGKKTDFFDVLGSLIIIVFNVLGTLQISIYKK